MKPLFLGLGALGIGYVAYKALSKDAPKAPVPGAKDPVGPIVDIGPDKAPPVALPPAPMGVKYGKTTGGGHMAYFEPNIADTLLASMLTADISPLPTTITPPDGPYALVMRAGGVTGFAFALDATQLGRWVLAPSKIAERLIKKEAATPEDNMLIATDNELKVSMLSTSGWAVIAAPHSLAWADGMTEEQIWAKLGPSSSFVASTGWSPRPTAGAMNPNELLTTYGAHLTALNAGAKEGLVLNFAVKGTDGTETTTSGLLAATMVLKDGMRVYPVVSLDDGSYPAPPPGTPFEVPETSVILARRELA